MLERRQTFRDAVLEAVPTHVKLTVESLLPVESRKMDEVARIVTNCQKTGT